MNRELTKAVYGKEKRNVWANRITCERFSKILDEFRGSIIVYDLETTGLNKTADRIVQIAAAKLERRNGKWGVTGQMNHLIKPPFPMPQAASSVNHITDEILKNEKSEKELFPEIERFFHGVETGDVIVAGYNIEHFDNILMDGLYKRYGREGFAPDSVDVKSVCMEILDRAVLPGKSFKQESVAEYLGFKEEGMHNAFTDVIVSGRILWHLTEYYRNFLQTGQDYYLGKAHIQINGMSDIWKSKEVNYIIVHASAVVNGRTAVATFYYDLYNKRWLEAEGDLMESADMRTFGREADVYAGGSIAKYRTARRRKT